MSPSLLNREVVFVVDTSATQRAMLSDMLEEFGCEPVVFENCAQCLEALSRRQPFLVLIDLKTIPMRGDTCCQQIKENEQWRHVPVIIMTSSDQPHEVMFCWRAAADDFLPKPITPAHLGSKVRALRNAVPAGLEANERLRGKKLLLVEDSRFYRNVVGGTLEQAGLHVLYAKDGEEAVKLATQHAQSIDASLIDLVLPKLHGFEVAKTLRGNPFLSTKPILLMSGVEEMTGAGQVKALELTGTPVLDKRLLPIETILQRVCSSLGNSVMELRAAERVPFFSVVEFRTGHQDWYSGFSYDVSTGGIFVRTLSPAPAGAELQLKILFAGQMGHNLSAGLVAWSNPYRPRAAFSAPLGMGIRFTRLDAQLTEQIAKVVTAGKTGPK